MFKDIQYELEMVAKREHLRYYVEYLRYYVEYLRYY